MRTPPWTLPLKLVLLLGFAATACAPALTPAPLPTAQIADLGLPPALDALRPAIAACAAQAPQLAIFVSSKAQQTGILQEADLFLWLGEDLPPNSFSALTGADRLVVITHASRTGEEISLEMLQQIYAGQIRDWRETGLGEGTIQLWTSPQQEITQQLFQQLYLGGQRMPTTTLIAPGPQELVEAVTKDPLAIGFTLASLLTPDVRELTIHGAETDSVPIFIVSQSEPEGGLRNLTACLQTGPGQELIDKILE